VGHVSVLLDEILSFVPSSDSEGFLLDVTAGGGGHFFSILKAHPRWRGECWDRDPDAVARIQQKGKDFLGRYQFLAKEFSKEAAIDTDFDFILADLGISSFQLDDPQRGLSFYSEAPLDFRMNIKEGPDAQLWLSQKSTKELEDILVKFGEEKNFRRISLALKKLGPDEFSSAQKATSFLMKELRLFHKQGTLHPLTRTYQALRIAVNDELGELQSFLTWAPRHLKKGGRIAIISFHSLEDRKVKRAFESLQSEGFKVLTPKALTPTEKELDENPRSRSAKLRVIERISS
jgi:16S rRNA (cytosine1402-N4)-methyltransferase